MELREVKPADTPRLLALNAASVRVLSPLDEQRLQYILALAHRSLVVEHAGQVAAFALAVAPDAPYDSKNYGWFSERYESFLYLDRIAVVASLRRRGLGAQLYDAMEGTAAFFGRMVCDVDIEPPNEVSLAFHAARGYRQVASLTHGNLKTIALFSKELASSA